MRLLSLHDILDITLKIHFGADGNVGQWPLFHIVFWTDERMGLDPATRLAQISHLVINASREEINDEPTPSAIGFKSTHAALAELLPVVEKAVIEARNSPAPP